MPEAVKDANSQIMAFMRDPLSMLLMAPLLPLMFLMQSLNTMMQPMIPVPVATQSLGSQYKNNERWIIERNTDGSIKSLNVTRDARVS